MLLHISRLGEVHHANIGVLNIDNEFFCYTMELPWLNDANDISCIPTGLYRVALTMSTRFEKVLPQVIMPVGSKRSGIRLHPASYVKDLLGCISCGYEYYLTPERVMLVRSRDAIHDLLERLQSSTTPITLEITF